MVHSIICNSGFVSVSSLPLNFFLENSPQYNVIFTCDKEIIIILQSDILKIFVKTPELFFCYSTTYHSTIFYDHIINTYLGFFTK